MKIEAEALCKLTYNTQQHLNKIKTLTGILHDLLDKGVKGDLYEYGTYKGDMSLVYTSVLSGTDKIFFGYDTFQGLPPADRKVDFKFSSKIKYPPGFLLADQKELVKRLDDSFVSLNIPQCKYTIVKGDIRDIVSDTECGPVMFASFDVDYYDTTKHLFYVVPDKVTEGGVIYVDDYNHWNGATKATDEFLEQNENWELFKVNSLHFLRRKDV